MLPQSCTTGEPQHKLFEDNGIMIRVDFDELIFIRVQGQKTIYGDMCHLFHNDQLISELYLFSQLMSSSLAYLE